jgi:hypothetical protein
MLHGWNLVKLAAVLAAEGLLYYLQVPIPPGLATVAGTIVGGALPSWITQWAPIDPGVAK